MRTAHRLVPIVTLLTLSACGGSSGSSPASLPVAQPGPDLAVASGVTVDLDGSASASATGAPLGYAWSQESGPAVALSSADTVRASFTSPVIPAGQPAATLVFTLIVHDGATVSAPASVSVTVSPEMTAAPLPVASAGPGQAVASQAAVLLDGSASVGGGTLTYAWTQASGAAVTLSGATTAHPGFTAPTVASGAAPLTLVFTLVVNDGAQTSAPSTVTVTVYPAGAVAPPPPGTPLPAPPAAPLPVGGSGSHRVEMGTDLSTGGLTIVDPASGEPTVEGFVVVSLAFGPAPADATVTVNGVAMKRLPGNGLFWQLDPAGPQPVVGSGGQLVLVATATDPQGGKSIRRALVLPCPADIPVTLTPAPGSPLVPATSLNLTSSSEILLNQGVPLFAPYGPKVTLWGYEPATRALVAYGGPRVIGTAGGFNLDVPVCPGAGACAATTAGGYLLDLRWPGPGVLDGQSGGYCQLAKRWFFPR